MILLIDNYDSFSYNLYQYVGMRNPDITVVRNDAITLREIKALRPTHVILSPGPGYPKDAGVCVSVARELGRQARVLGVCLGHQAICEAFGTTVSHAKHLMHGKQSDVTVSAECPLFAGLPASIRAARYHSLAAIRDTLPPCLSVVAEADDGEVMAVQHRQLPVYGLQFHPESILTPEGGHIIENFLAL